MLREKNCGLRKNKMSIDESSTMYGNPLSEFLMFLVDFFVFTARSIYFLLETLILTILPNRYRKLKVSVKTTTADILFNHTFECGSKNSATLFYLNMKLVIN